MNFGPVKYVNWSDEGMLVELLSGACIDYGRLTSRRSSDDGPKALENFFSKEYRSVIHDPSSISKFIF